MEQDKLLESDSDEQDETIDEIYNRSDANSEGDKNVQEAFFTKEEVEKMVGREIKDKEDFEKHYTNLKSKVGTLPPRVEKKIEPSIEAQIPSELLGIKEEWVEFKFVRKQPDAEKHIDLIRSIARGDKISLDKAYEKAKTYLDASETQFKEKEIAIESKNRIAPKETQKLKKVIQNFKENKTAKAEEDLVTEYLGLK